MITVSKDKTLCVQAALNRLKKGMSSEVLIYELFLYIYSTHIHVPMYIEVVDFVKAQIILLIHMALQIWQLGYVHCLQAHGNCINTLY